MSEFPTLIIILVCIFLIGLIPLAICALYTACQKRKWCAKLCLWDLRENPNMTTSVELDEVATSIREQQQQPASRPRSSVLVDMSHRSSHCSSQCEVSETASDPGMDHINRFLGRSLSDDSRNIYEGESDAGVLHIRRALGMMNKADDDPGTAHVRRALGLVGDVGDTNAQRQTELTVSSSDSAELPGNRASTASSHGVASIRERDENRHETDTTNIDNNTAVTPSSDTYTDSSLAEGSGGGGGGHVNTIDRLPSYEEALDILAKANEPEEPPPCYDEAVNNNRVSRTTEV